MAHKNVSTTLKYNIVGKNRTHIVDLIILFNALKKESVFVADNHFGEYECASEYDVQFTPTGELVGVVSTKYKVDKTVHNVVSVYTLLGSELNAIGVGECVVNGNSVVVDSIFVNSNYSQQSIDTLINKILCSDNQLVSKDIKYNSTPNKHIAHMYDIANCVDQTHTPLTQSVKDDCDVSFIKTMGLTNGGHLLFGNYYSSREIKRFVDLIEDRVNYYAQKSVNADNGFKPFYMLAKGKDNGIFAIVATYKLFRGKPSKDSFLKDNYISDPFDYNSARMSLERDEVLQLATEFQAYIYELGDIKSVGHIDCLPYTQDKKCAYIDNNYVNHNYQRQGISTALVEATLTYLKDNGYESYVLDVSKYDPINCPKPKKGDLTPAIKQWLKKGATYDDDRQQYETFFTKPFKGSLDGEIVSDLIIATSENIKE